MTRQLDPTSLRVFVSVVEEGTIAAAAAREHLVAAAVSKRISEIEGLLNTRLLVRTNKGVEPTDAGVALARLARKALAELDQIPLALKGHASGVSGLVRVCASPSALAQFVPADIKSFLDKHPGVQVELEAVTSWDVNKAVADHSADVGIFTSAPLHAGLETAAYRQDRLVLCTSKDHFLDGTPVSLLDVLDEDFVGVPPGTSIGTLLALGARARNRSLQVRMEAAGFDALCVMIGCGLGVSVLPEAIASRNAAALELKTIPLTDEWAVRKFWVCKRKDAQPVASRLLWMHLQEQAKLAMGSEGP